MSKSTITRLVGGAPTLKDWNLDLFESTDALIEELTRRCGAEAVAEALCDAYPVFPHLMHDEQPEHPLVIHLLFPELGDGRNPPALMIDLPAVLETDCCDCESDGSYREPLGDISAALRALADRIDVARGTYSED